MNEVWEKFKEFSVLTDGLPGSFIAKDDEVKLVFVGQYSAGKSSIIKMLTEENVEIGAAITTQTFKEYNWHGISIVDTPGISTELRPDHDEITYEQINHAALLVFVITNEGFNQCMGQHFRKLAIDQQRASNIVLVVNKMDRTEMGNTVDQQKIIMDDIDKVIAPYTADQVYLSFTDTNSYQESITETDEELRQSLLELSGYDVFVQHLNSFVRERKLLAHFERPLYTIANKIETALAHNNDTDNDDSVSAVADLLKRKRRILTEGEKKCQRKINHIAETCQYKICAVGRETAGAVQTDADEADVRTALDSAEVAIQREVDSCQQELTECINESLKNMIEDIELQDDSIFARKVHLDWQNNMEALKESSGFGTDSPFLSRISDVLRSAARKGNTIDGVLNGVDVEQRTAVAQLFNNDGMKALSGSIIHTSIKGLGKFAGIKFQPWQALRWSKYVDKIGGVLGALGTIYQIYTFLTDSGKKKEREQKAAESRTELRNEFGQLAKDVCNDMVGSAQEALQSQLEPAINELDKKIDAIDQLKKLMEKRQEVLSQLNDKVHDFISDLNAQNG